MKTTKKLLVGGAMLAFSAVSYGQFTMSGEIRPRMEYRHGYKTLADSNQTAATFTDQRSRLNFNYKDSGYQVKLVLQDIRVWGAAKQLNTMDGFSSIHEAWGQAFVTDNFSIKAGRQEIIYDDHRIFGSVGWAQQARSHDAIQLKYQKDGMKIDITGAYNQDGAGLAGTSSTLGSTAGNYKAFQSLWFHMPIGDNLKTSILFLNNGKQANDPVNGTYWDNYTQTVGTHTKFKKDKLSAGFNGYYQMGKTNSLKAKDVAAYLVGLDLGYKITDNLSATVGFEMQSGHDQTDTTTGYNDISHSFSPFYGTNHKFNGFMDYFYVGNHFNGVGLQDIYAKVKYKKKKTYVGLDFHMFSSAAPILDGYKIASDTSAAYNSAMNSSLGMEIDLSFGFQLSKGVMLKGGYSQMLGTETLAYLKGVTDYKGQGRIDQTSNWGYVMIIFKPTFIKTEKK